MARKRSHSGRGKAARLPTGRYAYRGRAVPFGKLPKKEQARFRSLWATKASKTRATEREIKARAPGKGKDRTKAREWFKRRTVKVEQQFDHNPKLRRLYPGYNPDPDNALAKLGPKAILAARELQRAAHKAYEAADSRAGGRARDVSDQIRESLGRDLANALPQLWWYH